MRILQIVTRRQRRGAEVFAAQLSDALAAAGHDVLFLGLYTSPEDHLTTTRARWDDLDSPRVPGISPPLVRALGERIRKERPDIVQANGSDTLKYTSLLRHLHVGRWPLVYRNISVASSWLRYPGQRAWLRWLLRKVDHVAAISTLARADLIETYRLKPEKVTPIPNGVVVPPHVDRGGMRVALAAAADLPVDGELLIHVGSFSPEKNHLWMLDALHTLFERRPQCRLVLVGDGPLRDTVLARVAELGLTERVRWIGSREDAAALMAGADVLLLPSLVEGVPGVVLEASAHGTPCVAANVGSMSDAVEHGRTGFLFESGDERGFTEAIARVLDDLDLRRSLGAAARALAQQDFGMDGVVASFESLYAELAESAGLSGVR